MEFKSRSASIILYFLYLFKHAKILHINTLSSFFTRITSGESSTNHPLSQLQLQPSYSMFDEFIKQTIRKTLNELKNCTNVCFICILNKEIFVCRKYLVSQLLPLKKSNLIQIGGIKDVGPTSALEVLL